MMKRAKSIEALLSKANTTLQVLRGEYAKALNDKTIGEELRVDIKNIFENLRSCLDYMAHEVSEMFGAGKKPNKLYFPIRMTPQEFSLAIAKDFPALEQKCKLAYTFLESLQPYCDPWLGKFNRLNNENKHQNLTEQTRTETRRVTVSHPNGGSVSWGHGVRFGGGVRVMGVPIDPRTQMPVANNEVETKVVIWVDFKFDEISESALSFTALSVKRVEQIYSELQKYC